MASALVIANAIIRARAALMVYMLAGPVTANHPYLNFVAISLPLADGRIGRRQWRAFSPRNQVGTRA